MSQNPVQGQTKAIDVLCAGAMSHIIEALSAEFHSMTGATVTLRFDRSGVVRDRVLRGEAADVVITTRPAMDVLAAKGKIVPGSAADVASSGIGVAIRAGARRPDVGTVDAFRQTLLSARSIAYADPATGSPSGMHLIDVFDQLGITAAIRSKTQLVGASDEGSVVVVCDVVARGDADIGIQQIAEILPVAGVELVAPLPPALQKMTVFSIAVATSAGNRETAARLVAFVTSERAHDVILAHGMEAP